MDKEEIRKRFDTLPPALKQAVANLDMGGITDGLRQKYNLHVDQLGKIAEEITLAMVGLTGVRDFGRNIRNKTGLSEDVVNLITYDINQQIFSKIRRDLEELSQAMSNPKPSAPANTVPPATTVGQPAEPNPVTPKVFDEKMDQVSNLSKQSVVIAPQTGDNKVRDPYRESIT